MTALIVKEMAYYCNKEDEVYYYHGDLCGSRAQSQACLSYAEMQQSVRSKHLGGANWITDVSGHPMQHLQYLPYGENYINQRVAGSTYNERYTFTGKCNMNPHSVTSQLSSF